MMGLQLQVSNSLNELAGKLAVALRQQAGNVFRKQMLITQTEGMNNWLSIQLSTRLGIHANSRFLKPNDLVSQLYYWLGDGKQVLAAGQLQWLVYNLLGERSFREQYPFIAAYYRADDVKRVALAGRIADLFDQYQVYRPEMIEAWNTEQALSTGDEDWQRYLWLKVKSLTAGALTDKISVVRHIARQLADPLQRQRLSDRLPGIHIFGISIITQLHVQLLQELSAFIPVHFYLLNPAPLVYWLDDKTEKQIARLAQLQKSRGNETERARGAGNNLLIGWGKLVKDTFSMLFGDDTFLNVYDDSAVVEPATTTSATLLQKIQADIFYNRDTTERAQLTVADTRDGSLTVHSCYTPVREVEALYNYLVQLADEKVKGISPREIVVMASDIDAYAPYIKAIFTTAPYRFPFTIADESIELGDSLFTAIESVLAISAETFKAEEVMELLDSSHIRERFGISDTSFLRRVVCMANIRFGLDGNREDDTFTVSWNNGMQRILLGICISGGAPYEIDGNTVYPLDVAEGQDALELVRFLHFIQVLRSFVERRQVNRSLAAWGLYIRQLADNMCVRAGQTEPGGDYQRLVNYLENLNELAASYDEPISFEVFRHSFLDIIGSEKRSGSFAAGGITFCSLIPMRSIPFRVVALLGMNFDKFPRNEVPLSFNLMEKNRRKGDRNVKDNDRHLFLETVLSAQQYLYISYIGRNPGDNSIQPPSALVDELLDYVASGMVEENTESLVVTQPLHGFSEQYFRNLPGLYSYLAEEGPAGNSGGQLVLKDEAMPETDEIAAGALLSFFKHPIKWYYNTILGIYYNDKAVLLPDTELFELDKLQEWKLKNDLLQLEEENLPEYRERAISTGNLPLKHMAELALTETWEGVARVRQMLEDCVGDTPCGTFSIDIKMSEATITGKIDGVYGDKVAAVSFSKKHGRDLLQGYLKYLLLAACGVNPTLFYISAAEDAVFTIPQNTIDPADAIESLNQLAALFKAGQKDVFLFFPGLNNKPLKMADCDATQLNKSIENFLERNPDPYLQKELGSGRFLNPAAAAAFVQNTLRILSPVVGLFPRLLS